MKRTMKMKLESKSFRNLRNMGAALILLLFWGCGGTQPKTLEINVWGETYVEDKIPKGDVEDGWDITFDRFLIVLGNVNLTNKSGQTGSVQSSMKVFDLKKKGAQGYSNSSTPAGSWDALSYEVSSADTKTISANASEADLAFMKKNGFSIYLEGKATKVNQTKTFRWGFKTQTVYKNCELKALGGEKSTVQLTIHADHFFYDDLESEDVKLRFDAIAKADKDKDGQVTLKELDAFGGKDFAGLSQYGVGRYSSVTDLGAFIKQLSRTLGHIDGEGHCEIGG